MGGAFSSRKLETNQPVMEGVSNIEQYGQNVGLGAAGKSSKSVIKQMMGGDYSKLAGTLLSPIHDRYAAQGREMERNAMLGGNALYAGSQPALMAGLQQDTRRKMAEGEGLAYGQAIPALWGQASNQFQNALNARRGLEFGALQSGLQGRIAGNQYVTKPGWLGQTLGAVSGIAGGLMGIPGLGGFGAQAAGNPSPPPTFSFPSWSSGVAENVTPPGLGGSMPFNPAAPPYNPYGGGGY